MKISQTCISLQGFATTELSASGIEPTLGQLNCRYLDGDTAIARFIESVDIVGFTGKKQLDAQWRALRKKGQLQVLERGALFFQGIDPLTDVPLNWIRCKPLQPRQNPQKPGKVVKYETLAGVSLRASYFAVTLEIWQNISNRYNIAMPEHVSLTDDGAALGFWQWVQEHPEIELVLTEGEKKALALLSVGFAAVSVPGVNCGYRCIKDTNGNVIGRHLHPDLLPFANDARRIVIAYDRDNEPATRAKVDAAIIKTAHLLSAAGAYPLIASWSGKKGIDDYIAAGGDAAKAIATAKHPITLTLHFARHRVLKQSDCGRAHVRTNAPCLSVIDPDIVPKTGIVAIVSGTGTGKTKLLERLSRETEAAIAPGCRISLQRGLSQRIGLTYLTDADRAEGHFIDANGQPTHKIGLCWDSLLAVPLWLYANGSYDLILDEADQGFMHLISGATCGKGGKRPALIERAIALIRGARRVILASATLTRHEIDLVQALRGGEQPWILQNDYQANNYPIELYSGQRGVKGSSSQAEASVVERLIAAIEAGQRVIVPTDQLQIARTIEQLGLKVGLMPNQILRFDRTTSAEDWQREFADRPDEFLSRHDIKLLVHSPSLTSGVSIEGDYFDLCVGIFKGQTISPNDVLQSLARVRKPIPRIAYVSHWGKGNSNIDATRKGDYLKQLHRRTQAIGTVLGKNFELDPNDPIELYHAATQADRNQAMANFGASVQALLEAAGHQVTIGNVDNSETGARALRLTVEKWKDTSKAVTKAGYREQFEAAQIDVLEAGELRAKKNLKHAEVLELFRHDLCQWYAIDPDQLTPDEVEFDRNGRARRGLTRLEWLLWEGLARAKDGAKLDKLQSHNAPIQAHDLPDGELFVRVIQKLGILEMLQLCLEESWDSKTPWVIELAAKARRYSKDLKLACGFSIHHKMGSCQIVGEILNKLELKTCSTQIRIPGGRTRVYTLDENSLQRVQEILQRRAKRHIKQGFKPVTCPLTTTFLSGVFPEPSEVENSAPDFDNSGGLKPIEMMILPETMVILPETLE